MSGRRNFSLAVLGMILGGLAFSRPAIAAPSSASTTNAVANPQPPAEVPAARKYHATDADGKNVPLNPPGHITVIVGTNEDSQDAARAAGRAMYPFQGRPDFGLIVVVDLRHTVASWVPSMVISRMKVSLDQEVFELKPYYLKNGNRNNPRGYSHVIPDFTGTICPQLEWKEHDEKLRIIIFGVDGRILESVDNLEAADMTKIQADVRKAIQAQVEIEQAKLAAAGKPQPFFPKPVLQHPPIVPYASFTTKQDDD
jgi:hypothetical protein